MNILIWRQKGQSAVFDMIIKGVQVQGQPLTHGAIYRINSPFGSVYGNYSRVNIKNSNCLVKKMQRDNLSKPIVVLIENVSFWQG